MAAPSATRLRVVGRFDGQRDRRGFTPRDVMRFRDAAGDGCKGSGIGRGRVWMGARRQAICDDLRAANDLGTWAYRRRIAAPMRATRSHGSVDFTIGGGLTA